MSIKTTEVSSEILQVKLPADKCPKQTLGQLRSLAEEAGVSKKSFRFDKIKKGLESFYYLFIPKDTTAKLCPGEVANIMGLKDEPWQRAVVA